MGQADLLSHSQQLPPHHQGADAASADHTEPQKLPQPYSREDLALAASLGAFLSSHFWQQPGLAQTRQPQAMSEAVAIAV